jgi:hypothetical protein
VCVIFNFKNWNLVVPTNFHTQLKTNVYYTVHLNDCCHDDWAESIRVLLNYFLVLLFRSLSKADILYLNKILWWHPWCNVWEKALDKQDVVKMQKEFYVNMLHRIVNSYYTSHLLSSMLRLKDSCREEKLFTTEGKISSFSLSCNKTNFHSSALFCLHRENYGNYIGLQVVTYPNISEPLTSLNPYLIRQPFPPVWDIC